MKQNKTFIFLFLGAFLFQGHLFSQEEAFFANPDSLKGSYFGYDIDMNENYAVVGSSTNGVDLFLEDPHPVYIFKKNEAGQWEIAASLIASDYAILESFGHNVAINDDNVIIVANTRHNDNSGSIYDKGVVYVFELINDEWIETSTIADPALSDEESGTFGYKVEIDGDYIMVSDISYGDNNEIGIVYIYHREAEEWILQGQLDSSTPSWNTNFGHHIAIKGDYAMVTEPSTMDSPDFPEKINIYKRNGSEWELETIFEEENSNEETLYAVSLAMDDSVAVVGASLLNDMDVPRYVEVLNLTENGWERGQKIYAADIGVSDDFYALEVAIKGDRLAIASPLDTGIVFIYENGGDEWIFKEAIAPSNSEENITFSWSIALSTTDMLVGAINWRDSILTNNGNLSYEDIGAVYFYDLGNVVATESIAFHPAQLKIFPNPVSELLHLEINSQQSKESQLSVYNAIGQVVLSNKIPKGQKKFTVDVSTLDAGLYFCEIKQNEQLVSKIFVKQ